MRSKATDGGGPSNCTKPQLQRRNGQIERAISITNARRFPMKYCCCKKTRHRMSERDLILRLNKYGRRKMANSAGRNRQRTPWISPGGLFFKGAHQRRPGDWPFGQGDIAYRPRGFARGWVGGFRTPIEDWPEIDNFRTSSITSGRRPI